MKKLEKDITFILLLYMNLIYLAGLAAQCYIIEDFSYLYISILIVIGSGLFLIYRHFLSKKPYRTASILIILGLLGVYCYIKSHWIVSFADDIYINFNEVCNEIINSNATYFSQYKPMLAITVPLGVIILLIITSAWFYDITVLLIFMLMLLLWYMGFSEAIKQRMPSYIFITSITCIVNSRFRTLKALSKKKIENYINFKEFIICSVLISLIAGLLVNVLPGAASGKYSGTLRNKIKTSLLGNGTNGSKAKGTSYGLALSGYNDSSIKLGGAVSIDDTLDFKVNAKRPVYLRGSAKDFYDGFTWTKKNVKTAKKEKQDLLPYQSANAFILFDKLESMSISPVNLNTSTIFVPEYVFNIDVGSNDIYYDEDLTFKSGKNISDAYNIIYIQYKDNLGVLSNSVNGSEYKDMDNEYASSLKRRPKVMSMYSRYLELPDNIPMRVYALVNEITKGCTTSGEKVEKIYKYLSSTYKYSLNVSDVPDGREFVDYFLFDEKKGYCTYFASAATIMCRIAGVPARFAEGFKMTDKKDSDGQYLVTNRNAHAWTEVLIGPETNLWTIVDCVPNAEELMSKEIEENKKASLSIDASKDSRTGNRKNINRKDIDRDAAAASHKPHLSLWQKIIVTLLSMIFLYYLINFIIFIYRRFVIIRSVSIIPLYLYYLRKLKAVGYSRPKNLGDMEFAYTLEDMDLRSRVIKLVNASYGEHFGGRKAVDIDRREYLRYIRSYTKKMKGSFR